MHMSPVVKYSTVENPKANLTRWTLLITIAGLVLIGFGVLLLTGSSTPQPDERTSQRIARTYLMGSATFRFDGIKDSLKSTATIRETTMNAPAHCR